MRRLGPSGGPRPALEHGRADHGVSEPHDRRSVLEKDVLPRERGEVRGHPASNGVQEGLGEPLSLVASRQHEPTEGLPHHAWDRRRDGRL